MQLDFVVPGPPVPKARPRFSRRTGPYTAMATQEAEMAVRSAYLAHANGVTFGEGPLSVSVTAYLPIPKSASHVKRLEMLSQKVRPLKRPDCDNLVKLVLDALNGVAYEDDKQIVWLCGIKRYSDIPRTEVSIWTTD